MTKQLNALGRRDLERRVAQSVLERAKTAPPEWRHVWYDAARAILAGEYDLVALTDRPGAELPPRGQRQCLCGDTFVPTYSRSKWCTSECRARATHLRRLGMERDAIATHLALRKFRREIQHVAELQRHPL